MGRGRAWRIATGAMLLAVGASRLLPPATKSLTLTFGGALFGASLVDGSHTALADPSAPAPQAASAVESPAPLQQTAVRGRTLRREHVIGAVALILLTGACALIAYPWLTHQNSARLQASSGGARASNTLGRAIAPKVDPQLHLVALGQRFALNKARITVTAAHLCQTGSKVLVDVPAAIQRLGSGEAISEPEYQLLDSNGVPHQPVAAVPLDVRRGTALHAAPPPSVYRESLDFQLPTASARGALKLQAVLASGSGPEYRVTVADASHRVGPSTDGNAACLSPGGQGAQ